MGISKYINKSTGIVLVITLVSIILFYLFNVYTFFLSDDYAMRYGFDGTLISANNIFDNVFVFYKTWGGGLFGCLFQYAFCSLNTKFFFNVFNTIIFTIFILLCSWLINDINKISWKSLVCFLLLFWFCCPDPDETLFWIVGSTAYLWTSTMCIAYIVVYLKFKDSSFNVIYKILLFLVSVTLAISHVIPALSISGAWVVYYVFNFKKIRGNVLPLSIGFWTGTCVIFFAPGNFVRLGTLPEPATYMTYIYQIIRSLTAYKALYLLVFALVVECFRNKSRCVNFIKSNEFLLLTLMWSVIAFSIVFRPSVRAAFFPECISTILLVKLMIERLSNTQMNVAVTILSVFFLIDYIYAFKLLKKQNELNDKFLTEIVANDGEVCFETIKSHHRMVNPIRYEEWTYFGLMDIYKLPQIKIHQLVYCEIIPIDNFCTDENLLENVNDYLYGGNSNFVLKMPDSIASSSMDVVINYTMPHSWHRDIRNKLGLFRYERTKEIKLNKDITSNGYGYYILPEIEGKGEILESIVIK